MADDFAQNVNTTGVAVFNGAVSGTIETTTDHDWFRFTAVAGSAYIIEAKARTTGDGTLGNPAFVIRDSNGASTGTYGVAGSAVTFRPTAAGTYYVDLYEGPYDVVNFPPRYATTGTYKLYVTAPPDDFPQDLSTTGAVAIGGSASGRIDYKGDIDWFKVQGQYVPGLLYLASAQSGSSTLTAVYASLTSDREYIQVYGKGTGTYNVTLTSDDDYAASTFTTGVLPMGGGVVSGKFDSRGRDADWFRFDATKGLSFQMRLQPSAGLGGSYSIAVYDAAGNEIREIHRSTAYTGYPTVLPPGGLFEIQPGSTFPMAGDTGTFYLGVTGGSSAYTISITSDDYADVPDSPAVGTLTAGATTRGVLFSSSDQDVFRAGLEPGKNYVATITAAPGATSYGFLLSGPDLQSRTTNTTGATAVIVAPPSGEVVLTATGLGGYSISLTEFADDFIAAPKTSGALQLGGSTAASLEFAGDRDWFKVDLVAGGVYKFWVKGQESLGAQASLLDPYAALYTEAGTLVASASDVLYRVLTPENAWTSARLYDPQFVFTAPFTGTYFLEASGGGTRVGTYVVEHTQLTQWDLIGGLLDKAWSGTPGTGATITYSFPTSMPANWAGGMTGFRPLTFVQQSAVREVLNKWSSVADITFVQAPSNDGQIRFGWGSLGSTTAGVTYLVENPTRLAQADIGFSSDIYDPLWALAQTPPYTDAGWARKNANLYDTLIHEIGHAIGLKHPGDYNGVSGRGEPPFLPYALDNTRFTAMSYQGPSGFETGGIFTAPGVLDVAAVQYLYGAKPGRAVSSDTYSSAFQGALSDAGGSDTLDFGDAANGSMVSLGAGTFSLVNGRSLAVAFDTRSIDSAVGTGTGEVMLGTDADNMLDGRAGDDQLSAGPGNDTLVGGAGNDTIDGGSGVDFGVYSGNRAAYATSFASGPRGPIFTARGTDGVDEVVRIERLQFTDKKIAIDLAAGEAGGNTVLVIGAAFGAAAIGARPDYVAAGLSLFDAGMPMEQVCTLAVNALGSPSNTDFVNTVYRNVTGVLPSPTELNSYVSLLAGSGGTMTQADLLMLAANTDVNKISINLTGLQQTGVEFV